METPLKEETIRLICVAALAVVGGMCLGWVMAEVSAHRGQIRAAKVPRIAKTEPQPQGAEQ